MFIVQEIGERIATPWRQSPRARRNMGQQSENIQAADIVDRAAPKEQTDAALQLIEPPAAQSGRQRRAAPTVGRRKRPSRPPCELDSWGGGNIYYETQWHDRRATYDVYCADAWGGEHELRA